MKNCESMKKYCYFLSRTSHVPFQILGAYLSILGTARAISSKWAPASFTQLQSDSASL